MGNQWSLCKSGYILCLKIRNRQEKTESQRRCYCFRPSFGLYWYIYCHLGARQIATLLPELKRTNSKLGVVSMCIGTGMGAAALIEREWWINSKYKLFLSMTYYL